uniref:Uncharacterized protein n=1 Tax=Crocodylus porosus TaxID=8502 RepID=A0A7M4FVT4_CROPO
MAMPDGSQCQWDQISRFELGVRAASSWSPHEVFWGVGAKYNHMARRVPEYHILRVQWKDLREKGPPIRPIHALATLSICLTPLAVALTLHKTRRSEPEP